MSIYHKHHIVPRHMGGTDDPSNLIQLTVEEHAEAHRKLFEQHGRWQDKLAWKTLSGQITFAEAARQARIESNKRRKGAVLSEEHKRKLSEATKGMPKSEETRKNISIGLKGIVRSEEHRKNLSAANKGRKHTEQARKNMSASRIGRKHSEETKRKIRESNIRTKNKHKTLLAQQNTI
jgi:hypothetical protein